MAAVNNTPVSVLLLALASSRNNLSTETRRIDLDGNLPGQQITATTQFRVFYAEPTLKVLAQMLSA
jgi:hypothetical protein